MNVTDTLVEAKLQVVNYKIQQAEKIGDADALPLLRKEKEDLLKIVKYRSGNL